MNNVSQTMPATAADLRELVFTALGTASTCWENVAGAGVFDSTRAAELGEELVTRIKGLLGWGEPHLGFATTRELIAELHARANVGAVSGEAWPAYSTTGDTPDDTEAHVQRLEAELRTIRAAADRALHP